MANDITLYRGNDRTYKVTVVDIDGAAFDLNGATLYFNVKKFDVETTYLISKSSAVASEILILTPPAAGKFEIYLVPDDSADLAGKHVYDITLEKGGKKYTIEKADIDFILPVKHNV